MCIRDRSTDTDHLSANEMESGMELSFALLLLLYLTVRCVLIDMWHITQSQVERQRIGKPFSNMISFIHFRKTFHFKPKSDFLVSFPFPLMGVLASRLIESVLL